MYQPPYVEEHLVSFKKLKSHKLTWLIRSVKHDCFSKDKYIKKHKKIYYIDGLIKSLKNDLKLPSSIIIDGYRFACIKFRNKADEALFILKYSETHLKVWSRYNATYEMNSVVEEKGPND